MERIQKQMSFLFEIDKVKEVFRQSLVVNGKREENDAEHSWHMSLVALTIKEYFRGEVNLEKTLGDVRPSKAEDELQAAIKLFSLLPDDQKEDFLRLWIEFEECETNEAKFAIDIKALCKI